MSFFQRTLVAPLRVSGRAVTATSSRSVAGFHSSAARRALSENDRAQDHPDRDQHIDRHKKDSVDRAKSGQGEWKPELASSSEQAVQGDKHDLSIEEMQKLGEKKAEEGKQPSGSSSNKVLGGNLN